MMYMHSNNETDKTIDVSRIANTSSFAARQLEVFLNDMRYINPRFTYLLTYFVPGNETAWERHVPVPARQGTVHARVVCVCVYAVSCRAVAVAAVRVRPTRRRRCRFLANFSRHGSTRPADKRTRRAADRCSHTSRSVLRLYNVYSTHLGVAR